MILIIQSYENFPGGAWIWDYPSFNHLAESYLSKFRAFENRMSGFQNKIKNVKPKMFDLIDETLTSYPLLQNDIFNS